MFKTLPYECYKKIRRKFLFGCLIKKGFNKKDIFEIIEDVELWGNSFCFSRGCIDVRECLRDLTQYCQRKYDDLIKKCKGE